MELDPTPRPLHPVGLPLTAKQPVSRDPSSAGTHSADRWLLVRKTSRPPGRKSRAASGQPALGVAPRSGSVLAHHEVEASARQRDPLGIRLDQREGRAEPALQPPRGGQLLAGEVDRHRGGPALASQAEKYAVPHASSDDVETPDVAEDAELPFRNGEQPPHHLGRAHMSSAAASVKRSFTTAHSARFSAISEALTWVTR